MDRDLGKRAPLLWLLLPFVAGLAFSRLASDFRPGAGWTLGLAALFALASAAAAFNKRPGFGRVWPFAICVSLFFSGFAVLQQLDGRLDPIWDELPPREARLVIRIDRIYGGSGERVRGLATVRGTDPHLAELKDQRLYFSLFLLAGQTAPQRTAEIRAVGRLSRVPAAEGDGFHAHLRSVGAGFIFDRAILQEQTAPPSRLEGLIRKASGRLEQVLSAGINGHDERRGIYLAMMLGRKEELRPEQRDEFLRSGTLHLFAISGLHIGVIAVSLYALFSLLRLPGAVTLAATLGALFAYVQVTGASPSAVRAFIMAAFILGARLARRPGNSLSALAASACVALALNPRDLFHPGFQMSYAIVASILMFGVVLAGRLQRRFSLFAALPEAEWSLGHHLLAFFQRGALTTLAIGISVSLISTLTGILHFQLFTPASLLLNLVLVPMAMLVIAAGFISLVGGLAVITPLSSLFNHAAILLIAFMEALVAIGSRLPGMVWQARFRPEWLGPLALTALLALIAAGYAGGWRRSRAPFYSPLAALLLILLFGVTYASS